MICEFCSPPLPVWHLARICWGKSAVNLGHNIKQKRICFHCSFCFHFTEKPAQVFGERGEASLCVSDGDKTARGPAERGASGLPGERLSEGCVETTSRRRVPMALGLQALSG